MQRQQGQQGGSYGTKQIGQMMQKAQNLPNQCKLQTRQCQLGKISITTITTVSDDTSYKQQCEHIRGRQFNQCQSFIQRQMGSYGTLLMSVSKQGQQAQGLELCCNELQNVEEECQCVAMQEVYRQLQKQQQQGSQQRGRRGGQPQTQDLQQIVQNLPNQCKLEVHQCRIPSAMF
ncbi:2S seed storage protein [Lactuca sativa]|uniref:2S seed storage protein n=1 Tax=Lactuca sativa TaxID=4236 RepID=UPI000CBC9195|nr:2S seed storage protein [Lactuca sativa]